MRNRKFFYDVIALFISYVNLFSYFFADLAACVSATVVANSIKRNKGPLNRTTESADGTISLECARREGHPAGYPRGDKPPGWASALCAVAWWNQEPS